MNSWGMETHSCGGLWDQRHATAHHTLWSHNHTRNPKARPDGCLDWINNVTFDWDIGFIMGDSASTANWKANVRGCYFVSPPGNTHSVALEKAGLQSANGLPNFSLYLDDCAMDGNGDGVLNVSKTGYALASGSYATSPTPFPNTGIPVTRDDYLTAYKKVLSAAGPLRYDAASGISLRDELTTILINNVVTQRRNHVSSPAGTGAGNGGFGTLNSAPPPTDTDRDGMPDFWESTLGWNPAVDDHNAQVPGGAYLSTNILGYTALEEYLHFLAVPHATIAKNISGSPSSLDVDLRKFTSGFTKTPVFTVTNATNGTITLLGDGRTAHFVPDLNFSGRARYDFTVTDSDGSTWTQSLLILVSSVGLPQNLTWKGDGASNLWNTSATNWLKGTNVVAFSPGDTTVFDDTGSLSPAVNIPAAVAPGGLTVSASNNYTFGGAGSIGGAMTLTKSGAGTLTLNTTNTYSGGTVVNDGKVIFGVPGAQGSGGLTLNGGTAQMADGDFVNPVSISGSGNLTGSSAVNNTLKGAIDGDGLWTLTIPTSRVVTEESDCSGFAGTILLSGPGVYRLNQGTFTWGNSNSVYDLGTNGILNNRAVAAQNIYLGALTGGFGSQLRGSDQSGAFTDTFLVGALNQDSIFNGSIRDGTGATAHQLALTKLGTGTLTLNGTNPASGAITVSGGKLIVNGSTGTGTLTVANGATLGGAGKIGGNLTGQSGASLTPGSAPGNADTLTVSNNLSLTSANLFFDFANVPTAGGGVNDLISLSGGSVTLAGISTVIPNYLNGTLAAGNYTLINGGASTTGSAANLAWGGVTGTRQTFTFDTSIPGAVLLSVSGSTSAALLWSGTNGNNWDFSTTNWLNTGNADKFFNTDTVLFNDTSTNGNVTIATAIQPGAITVSNSAIAYTFSGSAIAGSTTLQKYGAGSLTLSGSNSFTGGTLVSVGDIFLTNDIANQFGLGTGPVTLAGGTLNMFSTPATTNPSSWNLVVPVATAGRLNVDASSDLYGSLTGGGAFTLFVPSTNTTLYGDWSGFTGSVTVLTGAKGDLRLANLSGLPLAALSLSNNVSAYITVDPGADTTVDIGELSGSASAKLFGAPTEATLTWRVGGRNTDATFAGTIGESETNTTTAIEKIGSGTWTLTSSNSYEGDTTISAGTLRVRNTTGSATGLGDVQVLSGATLTGDGIIGGDATFSAGATLAPGNSPGTLTFNSGLTLDDNTALQFELGTNSDRVVVGGDLFLTGQLMVTNTGGLAPGSYTLFTCAGALNLGNLVLTGAPAGYNYSFDTNTVGTVKLVVAVSTPPAIGNAAISGGQLVFSGTGGTPDANYYVLTATNLATPATNWSRIQTNQFDGSGNFSVTNGPVTNAQNFYRLQLP
jgi:autotransporter-associated beta strand protein